MRQIELTPKELLIALLNRWKMMVALGLVLALLIGGFSYFSQSGAISKLTGNYNSELASHNADLAAKQSEIEAKTAIADAAEKYNSNSLLMTVDPSNKQVATLTFSVSVKPDYFNLELRNQRTLGVVDVGRSQITQLVSRYLILFESADLGELFSDLLPNKIEDAYLREMVSAKRYAQQERLEGDEGLITISVIGTKDLDPQLAAKKVFDFLKSQQSLLEGLIAPHTLTVLDDSLLQVADSDLAAKQAEKRSLYTTTMSQISGLKKEYDKLSADKPSLFKHAFKNAVFAFVLGFIIGLVVAAFSYLAKFPLQYALQVQEQLSIPFLGGVKPKKGYLLTALKNRLAGDNLLQNEKEAISVVAANLEGLLEPGSSVLLTGAMDLKIIEEVAKKLNAELKDKNITVVPGGHLGCSAQTVRDLSNVDGAVLLERLNVSKLRRVLSDKERLALMNKRLLGYMLY
ncbi:MAG: hypothetical protein QM308_07765 [Bacillota bacterium]|nr:hypothetical protein [Bacillota bacterium]